MGRFFHRRDRRAEVEIGLHEIRRDIDPVGRRDFIEMLTRRNIDEIALLMHITGDDIFREAFEVKVNRRQVGDIEESRSRQKQMRQMSDSLATHLRDNGIKNIVFLDRAARPVYLGLIHSWRRLYPKEKRPEIYFMNPDVTQRGNSFGKGYDLELEFEFKRNYPKLSQDHTAPVMVFDVCMHKAEGALDRAVRILKNAGMKDVRIGLAQPKEIISGEPGPDVDFFARGREADGGCYPFGRDMMTKKGRGLLTERADDELMLDCSRELRAVIRSKLR